MRISLFWKLMAAFTLVVLIGIGGGLGLAMQTAETEFRRYAGGSESGRWEELAADLAAYYAAQGSWQGVDTVIDGTGGPGNRRGSGAGGPDIALADDAGTIVFDQSGGTLGRQISAHEQATGLAIVVAGEQVGTLLPPGATTELVLSTEQQAFLTRLRWGLALSGGAAMIVALVLGAVLVRGITHPVQQISTASQAIAAGDLEARVPVRSQDEIGQLARTFNHMATKLSQAEEARRQQMADIAHELRTPLTIIQGHLEALVDGIFTANEEHLTPVLEQAHLLNRLVTDLRTLSLAETGRLTLARVPTDVSAWVEETVAGFRPLARERQIDLDVSCETRPLETTLDPARMSQVVGNVLSNALRYTPPGGKVSVHVASEGDQIRMAITDNGPGVPVEQLPLLFERFWRGDASRSRRTGGSGLGLAIARRIVEAHDGEIWAEQAPTGGLRVIVTLPKSNG